MRLGSGDRPMRPVIQSASFLSLMLAMPAAASAQNVRAALVPCEPVVSNRPLVLDRVSTNEPFPDLNKAKPGTTLDADLLKQIQSDASKLVFARLEQKPEGTRFNLVTVTLRCRPHPEQRSVDLTVNFEALRLLDGEAASVILDEAALVRPAMSSKELQFLSRLDYERSAGAIAGVRFGAHTSDTTARMVSSSNYTYWKALSEPFYHFSVNAEFLSWLGSSRRAVLGGHNNVWFENVQFADTSLSNWGNVFGLSSTRQIGRLSSRFDGGVRFGKARLVAPVTPQRRWEVAFEGAARQEISIANGFIQTSVLGDLGTVRGTTSFGRAMASARFFRNVAGMTVDVGGSGGMTSRVPAFRVLRAGPRLDPPLGDYTTTRSDFTWMGPVLRGTGVSGFGLVAAPSAEIEPGSRFHGFSVTLSLPGWSRQVFEVAGREKRDELAARLQAAFDAAVASTMTRLLQEGQPVERAERITLEESLELRRTLQNVIQHGRSWSLRPLILADWVKFNGTSEASAHALGYGVRVASVRFGVEALAVKNVKYQSVGSAAVSYYIFSLRARLGMLFD